MTGIFVLHESVIKTVHMFTNIMFLVHRKQIQDLNWQRKNDQLAGGAKLRELESKYVVWRFYMFISPFIGNMQVRFSSVVTSVSVFNSWVSLVSKNYEIERAIVQLENEMTQLRQQQGDENKENIRQDF